MLSKLSHEIKVGIFVLVGVILFCVSIILLGGDRLFLTSLYRLRVRLPQVQGLAKGSVVSLAGVPVGNVEKIRFIDKSSDIELVVAIDRDVQKRITEGSLASVKTQGALGDKYVYIDPGPLDGKPLLNDALLETDKSPDFLDIIASKGAEMGEVVDVIKEVHIMLKNFNADNRSARLMTNLVNSTDRLNRVLGETQDTMSLLRKDTLVPLASVMKKIDRGQGTLGQLINDPSLGNRLSSMLGAPTRNKFLKPLIRDAIETNEK
jgi:phospholipid/cholesterol/gamma-HCH transport system substrate-binding protein